MYACDYLWCAVPWCGAAALPVLVIQAWHHQHCACTHVDALSSVSLFVYCILLHGAMLQLPGLCLQVCTLSPSSIGVCVVCVCSVQALSNKLGLEARVHSASAAAAGFWAARFRDLDRSGYWGIVVESRCIACGCAAADSRVVLCCGGASCVVGSISAIRQRGRSSMRRIARQLGQ